MRWSNVPLERLCLGIQVSRGVIRLQLVFMVAPVFYAYCAVSLELVVLLAASLSSYRALVHVSGVAKLLWRTIGPDPPEPRGGQLRPILGTAASPYSPLATPTASSPFNTFLQSSKYHDTTIRSSVNSTATRHNNHSHGSFLEEGQEEG